MSTYKVIYFDLRALAEPIRWILKYARVPFIDERIPLEDWSQHKSNSRYPLGQVPIVEIDGQEFTQSLPIARYLCTKFGFVTNDPLSNYRSDQIAHIIEDARLLIRPMVIEPNLLTKEKMRCNIISNILPAHLTHISTLIEETKKETNGNGDYIVGNQITFGDFVLANWLDIWEQILDKDLLNNYPLLRKQKESVMNLSGIKTWIEQRPQTMV